MNAPSRCQSCGMPLTTPSYYGTNADGSDNTDFCTFCFKGGAYAEPDLTLEQMIEKSVAYMAGTGKWTEQEARALSETHIPLLKRWNK